MIDKSKLGYNKPLYILAFDHRSSFIKGIFGIESKQLNEEGFAQIAHFKSIIFEGFKKAVMASNVPKKSAALLVDEQFGDAILKEAVDLGFITCLSVERSGKEEFSFEYGDEYPDHIMKYKPTFAKALVRYNSEGDQALNFRQAKKLAELSDFCHKNNVKFLIEPLIPPTAEQLKKVEGHKSRFEKELRGGLAVQMVEQLQNAGVEPDVWKIEGLVKKEQYKAVVSQVQAGGRKNVSTVVLGRGESVEVVKHWLEAGRKIKGIMGFAIGRTIFWEPLIALRDATKSRIEVVDQIAERYCSFYEAFTGKK